MFMKRLYLIRHAKSSWSEPGLEDFQRPLNGRGRNDGAAMAKRFGDAGIIPDLIVASPAVRTRETAKFMAQGTGYAEDAIQYDTHLYLGSFSYHCRLLTALFQQVETLFLIGHNNTMSELAEHLSGRGLGNVPTCGVVALEYTEEIGFVDMAGMGRLLFFWFPKDHGGISQG